MPASPPEPSRATQYDDRFFDGLNVNSAQSAATVVPLLLEMIEPDSVIDVGCGEGIWLKSFADRGIEDYLGIDGAYVDRDRLKIPRERFRGFDLQKGFDPGRTFDLAICLEVAEHLDPHRADTFAANLARCAPVICFSAAIPGQGGTDHRNEQWPEYWADLFSSHGFGCYDVLRPHLWQSTQVSYWYAQNTVIFVHGDARDRLPAVTKKGSRRPDALVHPTLWNKTKQQHQADQRHIAQPGLKAASESLIRAAGQWIDKRLAFSPFAVASK